MTRLIKRYGNRKLYDTRESRYVTLEDLAGFVKSGEDLRVIDNDSAEDLTAVTLAQIILEEERKKSGFLPVPILRSMIQQGEAALQDIAERAGKTVEDIGSIVERGTESGRQLLDELRNAPQKSIESLQRQVDERLKQSLDRIRSFPAFQSELSRIEKSIQRLEESLARFRHGERGKASKDDKAGPSPTDPSPEPPDRD